MSAVDDTNTDPIQWFPNQESSGPGTLVLDSEGGAGETSPDVVRDVAINATPEETGADGRAAEVQERGGIVAARGTIEGLALRLDGRVERTDLRKALEDFLAARRSFFANQQVVLEWTACQPEDDFVSGLTSFLQETYGITVVASRLSEAIKMPAKPAATQLPAPDGPDPVTPSSAWTASSGRVESLRGRALRRMGDDANPNLQGLDRPMSLFDGVRTMRDGSAGSAASSLSRDPALWDDPDARIIYGTLRSGQKVESEHSIVIYGDVNSGAEVIAGGDIVVLGTLRGVAHAGAYDETGGGRTIFALNMQPTQLRIGLVISRGAPENRSQAEIARVDGTLIVVEPYQSKTAAGRKERF